MANLCGFSDVFSAPATMDAAGSKRGTACYVLGGLLCVL